MRAYVLINVRPGKVRDVVSAVSQFEGVRHADACWGLPDVFAFVDFHWKQAPDEFKGNTTKSGETLRIGGTQRKRRAPASEHV